jgi:hypothetical protein
MARAPQRMSRMPPRTRTALAILCPLRGTAGDALPRLWHPTATGWGSCLPSLWMGSPLAAGLRQIHAWHPRRAAS